MIINASMIVVWGPIIVLTPLNKFIFIITTMAITTIRDTGIGGMAIMAGMAITIGGVATVFTAGEADGAIMGGIMVFIEGSIEEAMGEDTAAIAVSI